MASSRPLWTQKYSRRHASYRSSNRTTCKTIAFTTTANDAANNGPRGQKVATFLCPSDSAECLSRGFGGNNYVINYGSDIFWAQTNTAGVFFFAGQGVKITEISDGMSNTSAASERLVGDFSNAVATDRTDLFQLASGARLHERRSGRRGLPGRQPHRPRDAMAIRLWWVLIQGFHMTLTRMPDYPIRGVAPSRPVPCSWSPNSAHTGV